MNKFIVVEKGFCVKPEMERPELDLTGLRMFTDEERKQIREFERNYFELMEQYEHHLRSLPRIICSPEYTVGEEIQGTIGYEVWSLTGWHPCSKEDYDLAIGQGIGDRRLVLVEEKKEPTDKELTEFASAVSLNACFSTLEQPAPIQDDKFLIVMNAAIEYWKNFNNETQRGIQYGLNLALEHYMKYATPPAQAEQPVQAEKGLMDTVSDIIFEAAIIKAIQDERELLRPSIQHFLSGGNVNGQFGIALKRLMRWVEKKTIEAALAARTEEQGDAVEFLEHIRDYEKESGKSICYDERTSNQLYQIFITSKTNKK